MQFIKHIYVLNLLASIPQPEYEVVKIVSRNTNYSVNKNVAITEEEACTCWDHLFEYIHANWAEPATMQYVNTLTQEQENEVKNCREMVSMDKDTILEKLETLPPYFAETIFPVAVARYLLRELRLPLNHRKLTTFIEFHRRYSALVLHYS